jgi:hypothetical protein
MTLLQDDVAISSPRELTVVLREVKAHLVSGSLRQIGVHIAPVPPTSLIDIPENGPWPDYVEAVLEDDQGCRYRLTVETFHGAGGSWSRI